MTCFVSNELLIPCYLPFLLCYIPLSYDCFATPFNLVLQNMVQDKQPHIVPHHLQLLQV
jgi:hypothetical protein